MAKGMTFEEARACDKPALWSGAEDEFLLNTPSGVVWWRPRVEGESLHGNSWRLLPWEKAIPQQGWTHGLDCECRYCR